LHWLCTCRDAFIFEDCVDDSPMRHDLTMRKLPRATAGLQFPTAPASASHLTKSSWQSILSLSRRRRSLSCL
jgi:hypothetical protein